MSESSADNNDPTLKIKNIILNVWNSLPNNFVSMKKFANALLAVFGSTDLCVKLFFPMNFVKSFNRYKLKLTEKCVKCMNTKYEPNTKKLAETSPRIEITGFVTHQLVLT